MIYVDQPNDYPESAISTKARRYGERWCHLWSDLDGINELHVFAQALEIPASYFQKIDGFPHYDLVLTKRGLALDRGATETTLRDWIKKSHLN